MTFTGQVLMTKDDKYQGKNGPVEVKLVVLVDLDPVVQNRFKKTIEVKLVGDSVPADLNSLVGKNLTIVPEDMTIAFGGMIRFVGRIASANALPAAKAA